MNYCVCCGAIIPEGRQVCWECEHKYMKMKGRYRRFNKKCN